jgi:hypothetical protein
MTKEELLNIELEKLKQAKAAYESAQLYEKVGIHSVPMMPVFKDGSWLYYQSKTEKLPWNDPKYSVLAIKLGMDYGNVAMVDLDCKEAVKIWKDIAKMFKIPLNTAVASRKSAPDSHWFYRVTHDGVRGKTNWKEPNGKNDEKHSEIAALMYCVSGKSVQGIAPPSIHPKSGEKWTWDKDTKEKIVKGIDPLATVDYDELKKAMNVLAVTVLIARRWDSGSGRHHHALAIAGMLRKCNMSEADVEVIVELAADLAGDEEVHDRLQCVATTFAIDDLNQVSGFKALEEEHDWNEAEIQCLSKWLGVRRQKEQPMPTIMDDGRIPVHVSNPDGPYGIFTDTLDAIRKWNENSESPLMYVADGEWVTLRTRGNTVEISPLRKEDIKLMLHEMVAFVKTNKDGSLSGTSVPNEVAEMVWTCVRRREHNRDLPHLNRIVRIPVIRKDKDEDGKSLVVSIDEEGYYPDQSLYADLKENEIKAVRAIREKPITREDAVAAYEKIRGIFDDVPFADEASWANCLAAMLTPIMDRWLNTSQRFPIWLIDSPTQGSGKTSLAQAIGQISGDIRVIKYKSDEDELEKALGALYRAGAGTIILDNMTGYIDSNILSIITTSDRTTFRILGVSEVKTYFNDKIIIGTSNNATLGRDMADRMLGIRLDTGLARPDQRQYKYKMLPSDWIAENHDKVIAWLHTMILYAIENDIVLQEGWKPRTRFKQWETQVNRVLFPVGVTQLAANLADVAEKDTAAEAWEMFITAWWKKFGDKPQQANYLAVIAFGNELDKVYGPLLDVVSSYDVPRVTTNSNAASQALGRMLTKRVDQVFPVGDGEVVLTKAKSNGKIEYRLVKKR